MHPLDDGVGGDHQTFVPNRRQHGGVITRSDQHLGRWAGETRQNARQEGVLAQVCDCHLGEPEPFATAADPRASELARLPAMTAVGAPTARPVGI